MTGGDSYAFSQALPAGVVVTTSVDGGEGFVADSQAIGELHLSPVSFQTFEENAGASNTSTVRIEANDLFVLQRADAAASLGAGTS